MTAEWHAPPTLNMRACKVTGNALQSCEVSQSWCLQECRLVPQQARTLSLGLVRDAQVFAALPLRHVGWRAG